jgi:hypothetical protein
MDPNAGMERLPELIHRTGGSMRGPMPNPLEALAVPSLDDKGFADLNRS